MVSVSDYGKEIVSILVPFITWFLNVGIKPRAKLVWTSPHSFTFLIQDPIRDADGNIVQPTRRVCTASVKVMNSGRDTAHRVELVFNWKPQHLNLWPVRIYEQSTDADGRHMLTFENLAPKEELGIEIMCVDGDLPRLLHVRSAECMAKEVHLMWFISMPQWRMRLARFFAVVGLSAVVYWAITLVQFLVLKTPSVG